MCNYPWRLWLQLVEEKVRLMQETIDQLQGCRPDLGLPEQAVQTLTVFTVIDHLQTLLHELQKVSVWSRLRPGLDHT